jgi:hypothetical protein
MRILSSQQRFSPSDEEVADLNSLITEVNMIENLTLKHSTVNKICKLLCDSKAKESISQKVSDSKQPQLAFKSKMKLELKSLQIDLIVVQMITNVQKMLQ